MKYYIIAGEASGDLHGGNLIRELKKMEPEAEFLCWGGEHMQQAGGNILKHYRDLAFMGFWEVITNLSTILSNIRFCKKDILHHNPDIIVFIDYPGFNLRMAKWAKKHGYKTIYYISPQLWAWKENRIETIKSYVDRMLVILPFEKEFYQKHAYAVDYVGHPLVQAIEDFRIKQRESKATFLPPGKPVIALLPGSRKQEIIKKLPEMLKATRYFPDFRFVVARAPETDETLYREAMKEYPDVLMVHNKSYALLSMATAALVTSGTATLETALFRVPQIICYKGNPLSYLIARKLIKVKYIGLVNLIMNKEVVKELIQQDLNEDNLVRELKAIAFPSATRNRILDDYEQLIRILSEEGPASRKAASIISEESRSLLKKQFE